MQSNSTIEQKKETSEACMLKEVWKIINGFGFYKISSAGRIDSLKSGIIMKPTIGGCGYFLVNLRCGGKSYLKLVHRLVAEHFLDNPEMKPQVNHKNLDKLDNRVENLEWCTNSENIQHAVKLGRLSGWKIPKDMKRDVSGLPWEEKKAYWRQVFLFQEQRRPNYSKCRK